MRAIKLIMSTKIQGLMTFVVLLMFAGACSAQQGASLSQILHSSLPGGVVEITVVSDVPLSKPGSFSTDNPARIALDFLGAKRGFTSSLIPINTGKVQSVVGVETPDRTRIIINLTDSARYEVIPASNGYAIKIFNDRALTDNIVAPKPFARQPDLGGSTTITSIDFRRSPNGGGSLIVDMSNDKATVDTRSRDGDIIVDILNVNIPADLERRLDVIDFATPVQSVDSFQNSNNVRMVVIPKGRQQHISFQSGNRFTLTVDPIIEEVGQDSVNPEDAELGYIGERLSINFQNIDIRSALTVIADFTGINFVTSDSVSGEISINLKDVPWDQALDVIMTSKGLAKRQTGNVIWVAPVSEIAEVERAELAAQELLLEKAPLVSEIIRINYANAEELAEVIEEVNDGQGGGGGGQSGGGNDVDSLLSPRGSVTSDERTNSILVQDVASRVADLRKLIAELDQPVRQVLIETRIVQANDDFSKELGARLGFQPIVARGSGNVVGSGTLSGLETIGLTNNGADIGGATFDTSIGQPGGLSVDLGAPGIGASPAGSFGFNLFRSGSSFAGLISLELSALEADGRGKIVASPKLITTNQQEASISQGTELFVNVEGGDGGAGSLEVIEAELQLIVTPQITPDDRIIMDVEINQDALILGTQAVSTTQIETQIIADNGETVVIGGIYDEDISETITKIPVLGDVPYIRHLFRSKSVRRDRSELLIFLTPKIISPKLNLG